MNVVVVFLEISIAVKQLFMFYLWLSLAGDCARWGAALTSWHAWQA